MKSNVSNRFAKSLLLGTGSMALAVTTHAADIAFNTDTTLTFNDIQSYDNGTVDRIGGGTGTVVNFDSGADYTFSGNLTLTGAWNRVTLNSGAALTVDGTLSADVSGVSLNGGTLTAGALRLGDNPNFVGALGDGKQTVEWGDSVINGSTIIASQSNANFISLNNDSGFASNNLWLNGDGATFDSNGFDIGGTMTMFGSGSLTKTGSGTLSLSTSNTFTGNTVISAGVLEVTTTGKLYGGGYIVSPVITVGVDATLRLNGWSWDAAGSIANLDYGRDRLVVNGGTLEYTGASNFNLGDPGSSSRNLTIGTGGATLKASSIAGQTWTLHSANGNLINNESLTLDGAGAGEIQKVIEGSGSVTKTGAGTWTLSGANTYTGNTTINGGTLVLADGARLTFAVTEAPAATMVTGTGTATFNGDFNIDTSAVSGTTGYIWQLVDVVNLNPASSFEATFNVIGFTQQGDGVTWTMSDAKGDWSFSEETGELTLDVGNDYEDWTTSNGVVGTETDDDDKDGLTNFEEYAFGTDPTGGSSVNPIVAPLEKATGTFSYTRRATPASTGLSYSVWTSTDLGTWTEDTGAEEGTPTLSGEVETVPVTVSAALLNNPKLFIQVRAD